MRITPLAVWTHTLSPSKIMQISYLDTQLTHNDITANNTVATYNVGIAHLLNNEGDAQGAIKAMGDFIATINDLVLTSWWDEVMEDKLPDATENIGFV